MKSATSPGHEIKFDHEVLRDAESITNGWGVYFRQLYASTDSVEYDNAFKRDIATEAEQIKRMKFSNG